MLKHSTSSFTTMVWRWCR